MSRQPIDPQAHVDDPALLLETVSRLLAERQLANLRAAGCTALRYSDGFVFQHLVPGPLAVSELARRMRMTAQGASKAVADLERRGYVARSVDPSDERVRLVALTDLGWQAVEGSRADRAATRRELRRLLGVAGAEQLTGALGALMRHLGGFEALQARRLTPPS